MYDKSICTGQLKFIYTRRKISRLALPTSCTPSSNALVFPIYQCSQLSFVFEDITPERLTPYLFLLTSGARHAVQCSTCFRPCIDIHKVILLYNPMQFEICVPLIGPGFYFFSVP
jgi:hypothetical protein